MGLLRIVMDRSIMVAEADIEELAEVLENLAASIKNLRVSRLLIHYTDDKSLNTLSSGLP